MRASSPLPARFLIAAPLFAAGLGLAGVATARVCPNGRFVVRSGLVAGGAASVATVELAPPKASLDGVCGPGRVKFTGRRVRATWRHCDRFPGKVRVRGRLTPDCETLDALLVARKAKVKTAIRATRSRCGDGIVDPGRAEECDDGNQLAGDDCNPDCTLSRCGDGFLGADEQCDDRNAVDGDSCSALCRFEQCGDGVRQGQEECDDGNFVYDDGCNTSCQLPRCGNGFREGKERCDGIDLGSVGCGDFGAEGGSLACTPDCDFDVSGCQFCGNGVREGSEVCDDGDVGGETCQSQGYPEGGTLGCQNACFSFDTRECFLCGNGTREGPEECDVNDVGGELCDAPGERGGQLSCTRDCRISRAGCWVCGNGRIDPGEECDDGNLDERDGCSPACTSECGDGFVEYAEGCDDGNLVDDDGCSRHCGIEQRYTGGGEEVYDACVVVWGVEGAADADGVFTCRDGSAPCDRGTASGACSFLVFYNLNSTAFIIPPPCFHRGIARLELAPDTSVDLAGRAKILDAFDDTLRRLGRASSVERDLLSVTPQPPMLRPGVAGAFLLDVPVGEQRVLALRATDAGEPPRIDEDRLVFVCQAAEP